MNRLKEIARLTGEKAYGVKDAHEATRIFEDAPRNSSITYLISYLPPESKDGGWRRIQVSLNAGKAYKDYTVRGKEGYFPN
jgi:hypothetical protein